MSDKSINSSEWRVKGIEKGINHRSLACTFNVNAGSIIQAATAKDSASMLRRLPTTLVRSARQRRTPHRFIMIMITKMEVTDWLHKNNDLYIQNAEELGDYAARFQPSYWIFRRSQFKEYLEKRQKDELMLGQKSFMGS